MINSELKGSYSVINVSHSPDTVKLREVESLINNVANIEAVVNVNNSNNKLDIKKECKVYNSNREEIASLSMGILQGDKITIIAEGSDEKEAVESLKHMIQNFKE